MSGRTGRGHPVARAVDWALPAWVTPNHLSFLRLALSGAILVMEFAGGSLGAIILLGLAAGFSDLFDGMLARQRGQSSALGAFLDPLGDKVFTVVLVVLIWHRQMLAEALLLSVFLTELHVVLAPAAVMLRRLRQGRKLWPPPKVQPNAWGKWKTAMVAAALGLVVIGSWAQWRPLVVGAAAMLVAGVAVGLVAEVLYLRDAWRGRFA
jgi:phosphatidylglycerophosphate synthase